MWGEGQSDTHVLVSISYLCLDKRTESTTWICLHVKKVGSDHLHWSELFVLPVSTVLLNLDEVPVGRPLSFQPLLFKMGGGSAQGFFLIYNIAFFARQQVELGDV